MEHDPESGPPDPGLADKLFALVEQDQGFAFISDGTGVLSRVEILNLARGALKFSRRVVRKLEKFLNEEERANVRSS